MEEKLITDYRGREFLEVVELTDDLRIRNTTLVWEDFLKSDGWIDFDKLDKRPELFICAFTGVGTGKTYGCSTFYLDKGNLGVLSNTSLGAELSVQALMDTFKLNGLEQYEDWEVKGTKVYDTEGTLRIKAGGLRNKGNSKTGRDFYTKDIMWDEFNQNFQQAQIRGQDPHQTMDTIINRWSDKNHRLEHIYLFGNKDGDTNLLNVQIMSDLGIYGLSEYTEVFIVERKVPGTDYWHPNVIVLNPRIDEEKAAAIRAVWVKDPIKYKKELSQIWSGTAKTAYFNDDEQSWVLDNLYFQFKRDNPDSIMDEYTYYLLHENKYYEMNLLKKYNDFKNMRLFMREVPKPLNNRVYCWNTPRVDGVKQLPSDTKIDLINMISSNTVLYDKVSTKLKFLNNVVK